jgi:myo-inositol-1-phosphate synthase
MNGEESDLVRDDSGHIGVHESAQDHPHESMRPSRLFAVLVVATVTVSLVSASLSSLSQVFSLSWKAFEKPKTVDLPSRIQTLTDSLNLAAKTIGQIETEIEQRQQLVRQLEKDAETASKVSVLNKEQMEAVAQVLRAEIKNDGQENFWRAQLLAFFYAALGVGLSEGYRFFLRWRVKRKLNG